MCSGLTISLLLRGAGFALGYWQGRQRRVAQENQGEALVRRALLRRFPSPAYHLLNHLTLPDGEGTTEIDHGLVARSGIFVLETKHDAGTLLVDPQAPRWIRQYGPAAWSFQNPLRQNYKHWLAVTRLLHGIPQRHIHPLVVFTGRATFHPGRPPGVVDLPGLVRHIQGYRTPVLSVQDLEWCVGRLACQRYRLSRQTDVEHHASLARTCGDVP
jgi:hypothetical protein